MPKPTTTEKQVAELLKLTVPGASTPNINELWRVTKDLNAMKLTMKYFGYELAKALMAALPPLPTGGPFQAALKCKPSTQADLESTWTRHWSAELKNAHIIHRKIWEHAYVLQALWQSGKIQPGMRGLGFGCGEEPIASYLAAKGCAITVTDLPPDDRRTKGWAETTQHASAEKSFHGKLIERAEFDRLVALRYVDMNDIPRDLRDYDFCWSICAFEHVGSIEKGMAFMENAIDTLKPGGISVHTTEFNFTDDAETLDNWDTVLFQQKHLEQIAARLEKKGCRVYPLDFDVGSRPLDRFIDVPPFPHDMRGQSIANWGKDAMHIKLSVDGFPCTCFGFIAVKG